MKKDYTEEIAFYKDLCYTCNHYLISNFAGSEFSEQLLSSVKKIKEVVIPNTKAGLQGVMQGYYDILREINNIPKDNLKELNEILFKKYGKNLDTEILKLRIDTITKRQKIINDSEYYIIEEIVNELYQTNPTSEKITLYNHMLTFYMKK